MKDQTLLSRFFMDRFLILTQYIFNANLLTGLNVFMKKSQPFFRTFFIEEEGWETIIDFTKFCEDGIPADELIKLLETSHIMTLSETLLVIPPNDAEAILISKLAEAIGLPIILSEQKHGASLDAEKQIVAKIKRTGCTEMIVVEMPGVKTETKIQNLGVKLTIIDHHHYTGLDRAHATNGKLLPSSLEQFLKLFRLTDARLDKMGFDPMLVRGIGIMDRGFVWALFDEGYSKKQVERVLKYHDELTTVLRDLKTEGKKHRWTLAAWNKRKSWNGYFVVETNKDFSLRPRLSRLVAVEFGKPTSLIILEKKRRLIYVQESNQAMKLFEAFGGFTFGLDHNWGYHNEAGKKQVGLKDVKNILE